MITFDSIQALTGVRIHHPAGAPRDFHSVSIDSRHINEDAVFCALKGETFDGHRFVEDAFEKGATGALVDKKEFDRLKQVLAGRFPDEGRRCLFGVPDTLKALQELARIHRKKHSVTVIGITGTNGKTSTKDMLAGVLSQKYSVLKTPGNYNNQIGLPLSLLSIDDNHGMAVIEMGANHPGEIRELAQLALPGIGIITNVGRGHLEFFGSVRGVAKTKMELIESLVPPAIGFVNGDDPNLRQFLSESKSVQTFGMEDENTVRGQIIEFDDSGCATVRIGKAGCIRLNVPGTGQVYNALAVYAVAQFLGMPHEMIKSGMESFTGNPNRGAWLDWNGVRIYNDSYNANPDSLLNAFTIVGGIPLPEENRRMALLGDMLELGGHSEREHRRMGKAAKDAGFDVIYTYGRYAGFLSDEARACGAGDARHFEDKTEMAGEVKKKPEKATLYS